MKKICLFAAMVCFVAGCEKNVQVRNTSLVGKWKLSESLADPGDGSGTWQPADALHPAYLEFHAGGTLTVSPNNIYSSDHYQTTSDSTMLFLRDSESFLIRYNFSETLLTLYPPCYEPCGQKYIAVK